MGILEQVTGLKERGVSEDEIVKRLSEQGISPNEIKESLSQAQIKSAVSSEQSENPEGNEQMEPSIMGLETSEESEGGGRLPTENVSDQDLTPPTPSNFNSQEQSRTRGFKPMTKEVSEERENNHSEEDYVPQAPGSGYPSYQEQDQFSPQYSEYPQEYQQGYSDSASYDSGNTDNVIEISEQVFSEKIKDVQKRIGEFTEFKTLAEVKIDNISNRLKRIETSIDQLQADILEKVGSYGRGIDGMKKEMTMMQESFGKVVNTLADKAEEKHKHTTSHTKRPAQHPTHKGNTAHPKKKSSSKSKKK